ncbi:hypothetical protein C8R48DRAFT_673412 [Suillus tomentosus]|nr:hypothetical protein C8R48DRAFT_673412 [Suillus tomentosus]
MLALHIHFFTLPNLLTGLDSSQKTRATEPGTRSHRQQDSLDYHHDDLEYDDHENNIQDNEDFLETLTTATNKTTRRTNSAKNRMKNRAKNRMKNKTMNKMTRKMTSKTNKIGGRIYQDHGPDIQTDNECDDPGIFDVLECYQAKNEWCKAPSPSHLLSILVCTCLLDVSSYVPTCILLLIY